MPSVSRLHVQRFLLHNENAARIDGQRLTNIDRHLPFEGIAEQIVAIGGQAA